jgi:hypothetical protein
VVYQKLYIASALRTFSFPLHASIRQCNSTFNTIGAGILLDPTVLSIDEVSDFEARRGIPKVP